MEKPRHIQSKDDVSGVSRRKFLFGAGASAAFIGANAKLLIDHLDETLSASEVEKAPEPEQIVESPEIMPQLRSENFDRFKKGYQAWWVMPYNSVVFVDEHNEPVAPPIAFQNFTIKRTRIRDGREVSEDYLLTPGAVDEDGFLTGNLANEWLRFIKPLVAKQYNADEADLRLWHVTEEFEAALQRSGDDILIAKIRQGEITRLIDIMHYYADQPVSDDDVRDKISYIEQTVEFTEAGISPVMKAELRTLVPALCAKESLFKDRRKNKDGAQGIAQFKSSVWAGLGLGEYGEQQPFTRQVEAIGLQFDQIYRELTFHEQTNKLLQDFESLFVSSESFEKYFLVPLMINAYNAGAKRMSDVIDAFVTTYSMTALRDQFAPIDGMDLFFAMSQYAVKNGVDRYGSDASQYVGYIYALRDVLEAEKRESNRQFASNE